MSKLIRYNPDAYTLKFKKRISEILAHTILWIVLVLFTCYSKWSDEGLYKLNNKAHAGQASRIIENKTEIFTHYEALSFAATALTDCFTFGYTNYKWKYTRCSSNHLSGEAKVNVFEIIDDRYLAAMSEGVNIYARSPYTPFLLESSKQSEWEFQAEINIELMKHKLQGANYPPKDTLTFKGTVRQENTNLKISRLSVVKGK